MSRFIWPSLLIMAAAIVAILLVRQPRVAAPGHSGTKPIPTRLKSAHAHEREFTSCLTETIREAELPSASRAPLSRAPFSHPLFHGVPGRAASAPPDVPYLTPRPAAWVDLDLSQNKLAPEFDQRVLALAQDVIAQTTGFTVARNSQSSPNLVEAPTEKDDEKDDKSFIPVSAASHPNWANAVAESDFRFRQLYGGRLWLEHHLQAHHLAAGNIPGDP